MREVGKLKKSARYFIFMKFFKNVSDANALMDGNLYCNSTDLFRVPSIGVYDKRYDNLESLKSKRKVDHMTMIFDNGEIIDTPVKNGVLKVYEPDVHLFCMYAMMIPQPNNEVEIRKLITNDTMKLGGHVVVLVYTNEFIKRVDEKLTREGHKALRGFINYYDVDNYKGEYGYFRKPSTYQHQSEYRYVINSYEGDFKPLNLSIGSIKDITEIYPTHEFINKKLKVFDDQFDII